MPRRSIAVVAAMHRELAPMLEGIRGQRSNGIEFFELETAVVAIGGIGHKAARKTAQAVVERYQPALLISAGIAGALTATLKVGDVAHGNEVVDVESGARFKTTGGESVIATVALVSGPSEKRLLADRYKADVVDMEAAAVAAVALEHEVQFRAIKAISDELEFEMPPLAKFVDEDGRFESMRFAAYVALRPKWWSTVRQLGANSGLASMNLSHELQHLIVGAQNNKREESIPLA
jgi:adenosylhomocysteine nucleosidase